MKVYDEAVATKADRLRAEWTPLDESAKAFRAYLAAAVKDRQARREEPKTLSAEEYKKWFAANPTAKKSEE